MGLRGPAPKPTSIREFEGNPGKRPLNKREPKPRETAPRCPEHLDDDARKEWRRIVPKLAQMRVLTEVDGIALAELCQTYSTLKKAQLGMNLLTKAANGKIVANPLLGIIRDCSYRLLQLCREFGLTPAARSRIQIVNENPEESTSSVLNGEWKPSGKPAKSKAGAAERLPVLGGAGGAGSTVLQ